MLISLVFIGLLLILGTVVYLNNPKSPTNRLYSIFVAVGIWWVAANLLSLSPNNTLAIFFARQITPSSVLACMFFYYFGLYYPYKLTGHSWRTKLYAIPAIIICLLSFTSLNFSTTTVGNTVEYTFGVLYWPYIIVMLGYVAGGIWELIKKYRVSKGRTRQQISFIFLGLSLTIVPAILIGAVLPAMGYEGLTNYAPYMSIFLIGFTGYSILRHRLFDIRAVVARSLTYIFTIALIGTVYGFIAFRVANIFLNDTSPLTQEVVYTLLAITLAFLFQPIRRFFEKVSNAIFYRGRYNSQQLVNDIGRILASEIQLNLLCSKVIAIVSKEMKISTVEIVVLSEKSVHFQTRVFSNELHEILTSDLKKLGRLMVVADDMAGGEKKAIMQKYGFSVSLALRTSEEFLGYLLLGEKKSGDIYNDEDLRTLKTIANELSVGLQNAKAFAEIQTFNVTLQQKINQATKNLRHANDQLKDLDKAKDEFISLASHQLRTPLTTVKGYVSMLDEGDFGKITKSQREPLEQALDGSNRMARLIDDLLNISRMEAGRFFIEAKPVDLNKVVPQEIAQLQNLAKTKGVELKFVAPKKAVPIMNLDENKTRQVIMNLADNAVHYSQPPKGGGKVEVHLDRDGDDIVYVVRDNGIGVPKDQQGQLFTKMFRARNAQEVRPDGTGLGLYLVKRVVEDQGGKVLFESEPGKGSMFGFRMPVHNKIVVNKAAQRKLAQAHKNS